MGSQGDDTSANGARVPPLSGPATAILRDKALTSKPVPTGVDGQPFTCLACGAYNRPNAQKCGNCGTLLVAPDEEFNIVPTGSARTSIGVVRGNNEDSLNMWARDGIVIALIADGMGGAAAGEEASRLAVEAIQADFLSDRRNSNQLTLMSELELSRRMVEAVRDANRAVVERAQNKPDLKGMGTTTTLLMVRSNRVLIAHVGDSRAYHMDQSGKLTQVTTDHSFVQALVTSGHITEEQARSHPMGNVLYRALGQSLDLDVDLYTRFVHAGDRLVICSDGLTRHLTPKDIAEVVAAEAEPSEATRRLIELANKRGGEDNISVIVIRLNEVRPPRDPINDQTRPLKPFP